MPLYMQVARIVLERASAGKLQAGSRLPSERALCAQLGVSRVTLRKALEVLVDEGVLESSQGRGWFLVTTGVLAEPPNALRSFTETARIRGLEPSSKILSAATREATLSEAESFSVAPGSELFVLQRVRCLDGIPVACDDIRVPIVLAPHLPQLDYRVDSLYAALQRAGAAPVRSDYAVEAAAAHGDIAAHLNLAEGDPVLRTTQTSYSATERVVEIGRTTYRGDRYRFRASLYRPLSERTTDAAFFSGP